MRRYLALIACLTVVMVSNLSSEPKDEIKTKAESYTKDLTELDPEIKALFPRWRVCEPELQIQIRRAFVLAGYNKADLDQDRIEVIAIPKRKPEPGVTEPEPYRILHISCGKASMNASDIKKHLRKVEPILAGDAAFLSNDENLEYKRDYCYEDIPPEISLTKQQQQAVIEWLAPTTVSHAFTLSLFEQTLKIGSSGFWIKNYFGNDQIGYPFWAPGEAKVILKRPLYKNTFGDEYTKMAIPYLIDAYLGVGYSNYAGLDKNNNLLSWVDPRKLNVYPGGKVIGGFDFSMPFHPQAGVHFNVEVPLTSLDNNKRIELKDYALYNKTINYDALPEDADSMNYNQVAPILRQSGQISLFYNFWFGKTQPENFLRVDLGLCYTEVREMGLYYAKGSGISIPTLTKNGASKETPLRTYKPNEFGDWLYLKVEYRNSASYPFGFSAQYSNQILLSRIYLPIFSDWLMLEAKYSTPLRGVRPYEVDKFFMVSPVLRITI